MKSNLTSYRAFSSVYDKFMGDAPYDAWLAWYRAQAFPKPPKVADVGCGTGILTCELASLADMIYGVDASEEMLAVALSRAGHGHNRIRFLCEDMRELRLPEPVDVIFSTCDSINYLLTEQDVVEAFTCFHNALRVGGRLCFDVLGPRRRHELRKGCFYDLRDSEEIWFVTDVNEDGRISYLLHGFMERDEERQLFERFVEEHQQQYYSTHVIQRGLTEVGFHVDSVLGDFGTSSLTESDRVAFLCTRVH